MRVIKYSTKLTVDKKVTLTKELSVNYSEIDNRFNAPSKVTDFAVGFLKMHELPEEHVYMVCLNNKLVMTSVFEISRGNVNSSIVGPREVFQKALLANACNIILIHNHPSGEVVPSSADIEVTERIKEAGELIGVPLMDHVIIGDGQFCSLKEKGYL